MFPITRMSVSSKTVMCSYFFLPIGNVIFIILDYIRLGELLDQNASYLMSIKEGHWVWHKKLGHASLRLTSKLQKHNFIKGLPSMS